jgi:hypothetical protein
MADANMAHCKLGRRGAQALRHALSTNTVISTLNLADNGLDAQVRFLVLRVWHCFDLVTSALMFLRHQIRHHNSSIATPRIFGMSHNGMLSALPIPYHCEPARH